MPGSLIRILFCCILFSLPWVGVGGIKFFSGHDVGGGLQPSWFFLALALGLLLLKSIRLWRPGNCFRSLDLKHPILVRITLLTLFSVMISGLGIFIAPSMEFVATSGIRLVKQMIQLLIMFAFLWWAVLWITDSQRWQFMLDFLFLGAVFQILYSLFQGMDFLYSWAWFSSLDTFFTSNPSILSGSEKLYINNIMQEIPRLRGTVCEPLYLGNYLLMVWPFLLVWRRPVSVRLAMGVCMLLLLVFTWSRGAWLGFAVQLTLLGFVLLTQKFRVSGWKSSVGDNRGIQRLLFVIPGLIVVIILGDILAGGWMSQRMLATFNNQDWSNLTRLYSMKAAWLAFLESPVVGVGWGQFAFHFPQLVEPMGLQSQFSWPVVNNYPLQILCETGLLGFAIFAGIGGFLAWKAQSVLLKKSASDESNMAILAALISTFGVWIQLLSFSQYNLPHIWFGLGLLLAAFNISNIDDAQNSHKEKS